MFSSGRWTFLVEASLVAELVDQRLRADHDKLAAGDLQLEDRAERLGQPHHRLDRRLGVEVGDVADDRARPRTGIGVRR
jgi:hypothetical protein